MIKISVIVPVYNVEKYLSKCLESLVNQTLKEIEIIVINDGSPDNSQKIIDEYVKKYPKKIRSFIKKNGGQGSARNLGLKYAVGEYISFVDSDDWIDLNAFEIMYNKLKSVKGDIVICDMVDHFVDGKELYHDCTNYFFKYEKSGSSSNKIFKKLLIDNLKFYEGIWYEDLNFTTKLLMQTNKICTVSEGLYHCNVREISTMTNNNSLKNLDIIVCLDDLKEYLKNNKIKKWKEVYSYLVFSNILIGAINRVSYHKENKDKSRVLKELTNYCRKNIYDYKKCDFYKSIPRNTKIVAWFNYHKMCYFSKIILYTKKIICGR